MRVSNENKLHQDRMESSRTFAVLVPGSVCLFWFFSERQKTHKCYLNLRAGCPLVLAWVSNLGFTRAQAARRNLWKCFPNHSPPQSEPLKRLAWVPPEASSTFRASLQPESWDKGLEGRLLPLLTRGQWVGAYDNSPRVAETLKALLQESQEPPQYCYHGYYISVIISKW